MDTGIQLNWSAGANNTRFGIGCKYNLDNDACVRAKVNNVSQIGLGYQQKLREGNIILTKTLSHLAFFLTFNLSYMHKYYIICSHLVKLKLKFMFNAF